MAAKKKTTSTGSPTLDAANAAKKFKAPKGYKPLTTAQKVAMAASMTPMGRAAKVATTTAKGAVNASKIAKGKAALAAREKRGAEMVKKITTDRIAKNSVKKVPAGSAAKSRRTKPNPYNPDKDYAYRADSAIRGHSGRRMVEPGKIAPTKKKLERAAKKELKTKGKLPEKTPRKSTWPPF